MKYEVLYRERYSTTIESITVELDEAFKADAEWYQQMVACERGLESICDQHELEPQDLNLIGAVRV